MGTSVCVRAWKRRGRGEVSGGDTMSGGRTHLGRGHSKAGDKHGAGWASATGQKAVDAGLTSSRRRQWRRLVADEVRRARWVCEHGRASAGDGERVARARKGERGDAG
ncbi:hypothetical protein FRC08_008560 [Ceratobasidium sp. 394]|nr:hypothetical protein FRC08_008560 [Ceratobasidium sp. 394]